MRLSDAMRIGAAIRPQCQGGMFRTSSKGIKYSCAVGAIMEGLTGRSDITVDDFLYATFPIFSKKVSCPVNHQTMMVPTASLGAIIIHLNDNHGWTRERIADWIDTIDIVPEPIVEEEELVCV